MIYVIRPSGGRLSDWFSWIYQTFLYTIAAVISSSFTGFIAGILGKITGMSSLSKGVLIVGIVSVLYGLNELGAIKLPMPQRKWQVPVSWIIQRKYFGSFLYGLTIGAGYLTYITYSGFYIWILLTFVLGDPLKGALFGAIYGFGRCITLIIGGFVLHKNETAIASFSQLVFIKAGIWHKISGILLIGSGILLFVL